VSSATQLVTTVTEMATAISEENYAVVTQKGIESITKIKSIIDSFTPLANAIQSLGIPSTVTDKIPERIFNYLLASNLDKAPAINGMLELLGLLDREDFNEDSVDPNNPPYTISTYNFSGIGDWFSNPATKMQSLYDWNSGSFDGTKLFSRIDKVLSRANFPVLYDETPTPTLDIVFVEAVPKTDITPRGISLRFKSGVSSGQQTIQQGDVKVDFKIDFQPPDNTVLVLQPNGSLFFQPPSSASSLSGEANIKLTIQRQSPPDPFILFGQTGGSRFEIGSFGVSLGTTVSWDGTKANGKFSFEASMNQGRVVIDTSSGDGFLSMILPGGGIDASFDLLIGVSTDRGFHFGGSSALEIQLPVHIEIGPIGIEGLTLGLKLKDGQFPISIGADIKAELGPIVAVVQNMGVTATFSFPPNNSGNLGPVQVDIGFKPPNGVGLSVDAGIVKGGGFLFLDPDKGEYAGALELSIQDTLQVAAIGIINTKFPDGTQGFSLLIIVAVQFTPGIALSMGFFLSGLGGMLGINRTINVPALRDGVKNDAIEHIMFPENVVANINTLLPQIKLIFPIQKDQFMIGFMAKITWGVPALITIEFGLVIEFTNPVRIAILGVLKIVLPTEEAAILQLQVNFVGIIDFDNGYLSFDASIYNSHILTFTLEGDMALRLNWGHSKGFLMSVGGFHPAFKPPQELNVPNLKRLTLTILSGNPNLVLTCYFAITSNTVQFGAKIDFRFEVSEFSVVGYLQFDVLFQFSPFKFICNISAGLEVKMGSSTLFSIHLDFQLSGPTPWNAQGTASFSILFFEIKVHFNVTWGDAQEVIEPSIAVLPKLLEAMNLDANWTTELPTNRFNLVTVANIPAEPGQIVLQSFGALKVSQLIMPLNIGIDKFGNNPLADIKFANVSAFRLGGADLSLDEVQEAFAPSVYKNMSDDDKLKSPSYTQEKGGAKVSDTNVLFVDYGWNRDVAYEVKISDFDPFPDPPPFEIDMDIFRLMIKGGAISKCPLSIENKQKNFVLNNAAVDIAEEQFVIVNNATLAQHGVDVFAGGSQAQANDALQTILAQQPQLQGKISIASAYQLGA